MSSTNKANNEISPAFNKEDFPLSQLIAALENNQGLVHIDVDPAFSKAKPDSSAVASDADWEKFWAAVAHINAPVAFLIEPSSHISAMKNDVDPGAVIGAISLFIDIAEKVWNFFSNLDDKAGRSAWTPKLVQDAYAQNSNFNYVVCDSKHNIKFDGVQDKDWSVRTYNYKLKIGSIPYKLYAFRSGVFSLLGDGGYLNWSFIGRVVSQDPDSRRPRNVVFRG